MTEWKRLGLATLLGAFIWACGDTESDDEPGAADALVPDAMVMDSGLADAMVDLVAACSAAIECAIDTPRQRDDCGQEQGETVDGLYQALLECAQRAEGGSCDTQSSVHVACLADNCAGEASDCLGPLPAETGSATCAEVYGCIVACEGNVQCTFDCYQQGTAEALRIFDRLQDCNALAVCTLDDLDCIGRPCGQLVRACMRQKVTLLE